MDAVVRSSARIETDERRVYTVAAKFEGYIDKLHVNATNQTIVKGQPLFEVYSPELVSAQREYLIAVQGQGQLKDAPATAQDSMRQLADSALLRLKNWDISDEQIRHLRASAQAQRTVSFLAPVSGVVIEKKAQQGMRFMPGEMLYQVADLSTVWVVADVPERDLAQVRLGATAQVLIPAYPGESRVAKVSYIYPRLTIETRTVGVRLELTNPKGLLKPGMFAQVELSTAAGGKVLAVPESSVLDSGTRSVVLVQTAVGRFEPRSVVLGRRSAGYVQVLEGVSEGDAVVVAANFLIDAESNLKAALQGLSPAPAASAPATGATGGKTVGYQASGKVVSVDSAAETATLAHGPVPALKWPGMTMDFRIANSALLKDLTPGRTVQFEFVQRAQGEWVITAVQAGSTAAAHAH
jgi:RND family efflux transporter MFP subunit